MIFWCSENEKPETRKISENLWKIEKLKAEQFTDVESAGIEFFVAELWSALLCTVTNPRITEKDFHVDYERAPTAVNSPPD